MHNELIHHRIDLFAPLDGVCLPIERVRDPVFAGRVLGDGVAIEPTSSVLCAPCAGKVVQLARTGHALSLRLANQAEVLIHVGIDTVALQGRGFVARVREGDTVVAGQPLIEFDADSIARSAPSLQTLVVLTSTGFVLSGKAQGRVECGKSAWMSVAPEGGNSVKPAAANAQPGQSCTLQAVVRHGGGLHARPAATLQAAIRHLTADVALVLGGRQADARSVSAVMALGVNEGDEITVLATGVQAMQAAQAAVLALETASAAPEPVAQAQTPGTAAHDGRGLRGVAGAPGLCLGTAFWLRATAVELPSTSLGRDREMALLQTALVQVRRNVAQAVRQASQGGAEQAQAIFSAHLAMLEDPVLLACVEQRIAAGAPAGVSLRHVLREQAQRLLSLNKPLLAQRVADLQDLERQLLVAMGYGSAAPVDLPHQSIVLADDLTPSELTQLPRADLAGLVMVHGGSSSHVAILARALGVPLLVAVGSQLAAVRNGQLLVLDADRGSLLTEPTSEEIAAAQLRMQRDQQRRQQAAQEGQNPAHTSDGVHIEVAANIASLQDAQACIAQGADGVGLLRTEFLFEGRADMPTVAEQLDTYQSIVDALQGRPVIIRTLDAGGDKEVSYLTLPKEANPALGLRGIRTGFDQPKVLDAQLRALLAVKHQAQMRVLIPMVADVAEVVRVRGLIDALARELGLVQLPELGVMIEVPSAALLAEQLARHVDFFSIGTNDLTQYTLAMDRCHPALAGQLDPLHPSVLRLIDMTVQGARAHGKWVGMCGGMASDLDAVPVLVGLGITELSVSAPLIAQVKARVRVVSQAQCRPMALELLQLDSAQGVRQAARLQWPG
jgi:phosphoenolpyruvate-protein phosphotransferase